MKFIGYFKVLCCLALLLSFSANAYAFPERDGGKFKRGFLDRRVERMQNKLNLSDEQANQVSDVLSKAHEVREKCDSLSQFTARRDCRKTHREQVKQKLSSILSPEQQAKMKEMKKKWKENRKHHGGFRGHQR